MWVFACGMFRSGSTLQFQLASVLIERAGLGRRMPWSMPEDFAAAAPPHDESEDLLVFKTHVCKHPMRERLLDGRAIGVGCHRDLRDVAVSGAHKACVEPDAEYCRELMTGLMACANGWPETDAILEFSYEQLTRNTADCCLRMAKHLGVPCTEQQAQELSREFGPERQRERIAGAIRAEGMTKPTPDSDMLHMERELLHPNHLAGGQTGKWRGVLADEAVAVIEDIAGDWLTRRGYELVTGGAAA